MRKMLLMCFTAWACAGMAALPEVSDEAAAALGSAAGVPQRNGFVFIDGKYLPPPYTVTRRGNGIFINRIQVEQPVPWFDSAQERRKKLDDDGDFEVAEEEEKVVLGDELLFGDADGAKQEADAHAIDALFEDIAPAKKKVPEKKPAPAPQPPTDAALSKQQVEELKGRLDAVRKKYETTLGQGDIYFFAQRHRPVNGTYGSAKTLFAVLPAALRSAQSPQDLMARLKQGGVFFLDPETCADLYKNRTSFIQLEERQRQIERDEAVKRAAAARPR